jgi:hypothetical protein
MTDAAEGFEPTEADRATGTTTLDPPGPVAGAGGDVGPSASDDAADGDTTEGSPGGSGPRYPVHRLRDLDRAGRVWAVLFALGLLLAPALAFSWAAPDWVPANDPALMGLRVLDVGTSATPLTGQPSTSAHYVGGERPVDHPGPTHFYLMAPFVRVLGISVGMVTTSVLITGGCVLIAAWAVFRQLGRAAGVAAAVALGAITFTTGASSLVNPVSSSIAGYPLLCSMVLLWCLLCGDLRLLPLATAVVSFTAQQHLSVLPALVVAVALTLAVAGWGQWRSRGRADAPSRPELARWGGGALAVALVMWAPLLLQEVADRPGNLTLIVQFAGNSDREPVGMGSAVTQLVNTLGLPTLLFRTNLDGATVLRSPSVFTWASAAVVVIVLAALGVAWRRSHPRRTTLVVSIGIVALGGLVNGASVPDSLEQLRLPFYHWTFALSLLVLVALALGVADLASRVVPARVARSGLARPAAAAVALVALAGPALVNPSLDRRTNTLAQAYSPAKRSMIDELVDEIAAHRDELGEHTLALSRGGVYFEGLGESVVVMLADRGIDLELTSSHLFFVDDERLVSRDTVDSGLLVVEEGVGRTYDGPGHLIAEASLVPGFDNEAYDELRAAAQAEAEAQRGHEVVLGPEVQAAFPHIPPDVLAASTADPAIERPADEMVALLRSLDTPESIEEVQELLLLLSIPRDPGHALADPGVLRQVIDHPGAVPYLDAGTAERLRASLPDDFHPDKPLRMRVYLLTRAEVLATASHRELS